VRKIREILRLQAAGLSGRQIAAAIGSALSTVPACLRRAEAAGLASPLDEALTEAVRIPPDAGHRFHRKPATGSTACRPPCEGVPTAAVLTG
jgi:hypothetical protein